MHCRSSPALHLNEAEFNDLTVSFPFAELSGAEVGSSNIGSVRSAARLPLAWPGRAGSLSNLAVYLGNLGRPEYALTAIPEATGIYRELASK